MKEDDREEELYLLQLRQSRLRAALNDYEYCTMKYGPTPPNAGEQKMRDQVMKEMLDELNVVVLAHEIEMGLTTLVEALTSSVESTRIAAQTLMRKKDGHG